MDLTGKPFEASDGKNNRKKILDHAKKTVECKDSESNQLTFPLKTVRYKLNKTLALEKKAFRSKLIGTLQNWN